MEQCTRTIVIPWFIISQTTLEIAAKTDHVIVIVIFKKHMCGTVFDFKIIIINFFLLIKKRFDFYPYFFVFSVILSCL